MRLPGATSNGTLEFAVSALVYFTVLAYAGPSLLLILFLLPLFPGLPGLPALLVLLAAGLLVQALNLKWVYLGRQRMVRVSTELLAAQLVSAGLYFAWVWGGGT